MLDYSGSFTGAFGTAPVTLLAENKEDGRESGATGGLVVASPPNINWQFPVGHESQSCAVEWYYPRELAVFHPLRSVGGQSGAHDRSANLDLGRGRYARP